MKTRSAVLKIWSEDLSGVPKAFSGDPQVKTIFGILKHQCLFHFPSLTSGEWGFLEATRLDMMSSL